MFPLFFPVIHLFIVITALAIAWYLLVIKPQQVMQRKITQLQAMLREGVMVETNSGIQGIVTAILTNVIIIRTEDGELIEILPWSIANVIEQS